MYVDGVLDTTWSSSGKTTQFEGIDLADSGSALTVELRGVLADTEWISISEVYSRVPVAEVVHHLSVRPNQLVRILEEMVLFVKGFRRGKYKNVGR